jgi:hypothetical protein
VVTLENVHFADTEADGNVHKVGEIAFSYMSLPNCTQHQDESLQAMDENQNFYALVSAELNLAAVLPNCLVTPYLFCYLVMKSVGCF